MAKAAPLPTLKVLATSPALLSRIVLSCKLTEGLPARQSHSTLGLVEHPEGGYYRETYRAAGRLPGARGGDHPSGRTFSTAIYYLLRSGQVSRMHRLRSDELFHYYCGAPFVTHVLDPDGRLETLELGPDPERGQVLQARVPAGCWFGSEVPRPDSFALVGCTVAPGFEFADFEMGRRSGLLERYPDHREIIERLTAEE